MDNFFWSMLQNALILGAPLVLAAMGGLLSERSGVINIALEGKMLAAACAAVFFGTMTGSPLAALIGAICAGVLFGAAHAVLTQVYGIDHIISGMGINAISLGATTLFAKSLPELQATASAPSFEPALFRWGSIIIAILIALYFAKTRGGLRLFAVGNDPDKARQMGLKPVAIRWRALIGAGVLCGLSGALLGANAGSFVMNMTDGRGYIALAALILGGWRAIPALLGCLLFGLFDGLNLMLQGEAIFGVNLPPELWKILPYAAALFTIAVFSGKNRAPAGLGRP